MDDHAVSILLSGYRDRKPVLWRSDGVTRIANFAEKTIQPMQLWDGHSFSDLYEPPLRLIIIGSDATALALAGLALYLGTDTVLVNPGGHANAPFAGINYVRSGAAEALSLDRWTAVAVVTHDRDNDEDLLAAALSSDAFYVGAIGARSRRQNRLERLQKLGVNEAADCPAAGANRASRPCQIAA